LSLIWEEEGKSLLVDFLGLGELVWFDFLDLKFLIFGF
jgi:hypothetical protein